MEIAIIAILTLINGFFSLSEIALVSTKKSKLEQLSSKGDARAKVVLELQNNPENFLSAVQVGITLIGIVSGAYGGAALTDDMYQIFANFGFQGKFAMTTAMVTVIASITYFTIVVGELVPKTLALNNPEKIALICVPIINYFTKIVFPFVKLLSISTKLILKILGVKENDNDHISEDELKFMLRTAGNQGVLESDESKVHQNLFYFTDQNAKSLMTHSTQIEWINAQKSNTEIIEQLKHSVHSKFLVCDGQLDKIIGVLKIKDFFESYNLSEEFDIKEEVTEPIFIIQNTPAFKILNTFKTKKQYIAIVVDEYGSIKGIVTLHDIIEAIVGDLPDEDEADGEDIVMRSDGSYLLDGTTLIYEFNQFFQEILIEDNIAQYTTVSGFILDQLKNIPKVSDKVHFKNMTFEIMDLDGFRIDKILLTFED